MIKQFIIEQKNMLIGFAVVLVMFIGFVWLSQPGTSSGSGAGNGGLSTLSVAEKSYDFGTVSMAAGKVSRRFTVQNTGGSPVSLTKLYTSCMCTTASIVAGDRRLGPFGMPGHGFIPPIDEVVEAGQSVDVEVVFDPTAHGPAGVGRIDRVITLENDAGSPIELQISANVTP